ncbi:MaoC family dehydratase [Agrobacterium sp. ES01]|uniref:MaoC family dehydratase n=1 Tax=Agrobacterium sp. ES01 TaxID=3420714 RepID=UPI003D12DB28
MAELYPLGQKTAIGQARFDADDIIRFAKKFDPQPFHTDAEAAKDYVFGALCASGWHTCCAWMRCFVDYWKAETERMAREGIEPPKIGPSSGFRELRWLKPVYAGDTLDFSVSLLESRTLENRPGWIFLSTEGEGINQHGQPVLRFKSSLLEFI